MDAGSLSPVFLRSPEPEDVNSLLRLSTDTKQKNLGPSSFKTLNTVFKPPTSSPVLSPILPQAKNGTFSKEKTQSSLKPLPSRTSLQGSKPELQIISKPRENLKMIELIAEPLLMTMSTENHLATNQDKIELLKPFSKKAEQALKPLVTISRNATPMKLNPLPDSVTVSPSNEHKNREVIGVPTNIKSASTGLEEHENHLTELTESLESLKKVEEKKHKSLLAEFKLKLKNQFEKEKKEIEEQQKAQMETFHSEQKAKMDLDLKNLKDITEKEKKTEIETLRSKLNEAHTVFKKSAEVEFVAKKQEIEKKYEAQLKKFQSEVEINYKTKESLIKQEYDMQLKEYDIENQKNQIKIQEELKKELEDWKSSESAKSIKEATQALSLSLSQKEQEVAEMDKHLHDLNRQRISLEENIKRLQQQEKAISAKNGKPMRFPGQTYSKSSSIDSTIAPVIEEDVPKRRDGEPVPQPRQDSEVLGRMSIIDARLESLCHQVENLSNQIPLKTPEPPSNWKSREMWVNNESSSSSDEKDENQNTKVKVLLSRNLKREPDLQNEPEKIMRECKQKLEELEKRYLGRNLDDQTGKSRHIDSGHSYHSTSNRNAVLKKAKKILDHENHRRNSQIFHHQNKKLGSMADKLAKKLNREAAELARLESYLRRSCDMKSQDYQKLSKTYTKQFNQSSSDISTNTDPEDTSEFYIKDKKISHKPTMQNYVPYQPHIPYVPLTIQLSQHQQLHLEESHMSKQGVNGKVRQAWIECFGDSKAPVIREKSEQMRDPHIIVKNQHVPWTEKMREINKSILDSGGFKSGKKSNNYALY